MNITEKILARASSKDKLDPGDVVFANVDKVMLHDVSGPGVIKTFENNANEAFIYTNDDKQEEKIMYDPISNELKLVKDPLNAKVESTSFMIL